MAKWGEGDPRWIVEERADAKNVNNWHWTEKNATPWSKTRLKELFDGLEIKSDKGKLKITDVTKLEGEACANNRKAKLIFFYEWVINMEWSGTLSDSENVLKGKVEIPNLSEEHEPEDVDVLVTANRNTNEGDKLKGIMRKEGAKVIREKLGQYIKELKQEFSQGMILPAKDKHTEIKASVNGSIQVPAKSSPVQARKDDKKENEPNNKVGCPISTKKLEMKDEFLASAGDLYSFLTTQERLQAFTRAPAKVDATRGGSFVLFDGNVSGKFMELVTDEKIVMHWRYKNWPEAHYSSATISLQQLDDRTKLTLVQTGVPEAELERTKGNWKNYYWEAIKRTFHCGMKYF